MNERVRLVTLRRIREQLSVDTDEEVHALQTASRALSQVRTLSQETSIPDELGTDGDEVLRVLVELGVMSERPDGRIDVPDIYRYGFGISRKGGVKRPV
jgi:hypothetical protein